MNDPTDPDSVPSYDGLGWADYWSISDWMTWHSAMKSAFGLEVANSRFIYAWGQDSIWNSVPLSARSFDSSFRDYAKANGFFDALFGNGLGVLAKPLGVVSDVGDGVSSLGDGVKSAAGAVGFVLPAVALVALALWAVKYSPTLKTS